MPVNNQYLLEKIEQQEERIGELESKVRYLELMLSSNHVGYMKTFRSQQDINVQVFKDLNELRSDMDD